MVDADPSGKSSPSIRPAQPLGVVGIRSEQMVAIMSEWLVGITLEQVVAIKSEWVVGSSRNPHPSVGAHNFKANQGGYLCDNVIDNLIGRFSG